MTDEEFLFREDVAEKKRTATGAHHRVSHRGRGLPSDYLKPKEREKMNSNITTYPMNRPVKWSEFRGWPADIQKDYLKSIYQNHHVTGRMLAEMFDRNPQTVQQYLALHDLPTAPYRGASRKDRADWEIFCLGGHPDPVGEPGEPGVQEEADIPAKEIGIPSVIPCGFTMLDPKSGNLTFHGTVAEVLLAVRRLFAGDPNVEMTVSWEVQDA